MMRYLLFIGYFILISSLLMGQSDRSVSSGDLLRQLQRADAGGDFHMETDSLLVANYYKLLEKNKTVTGVHGYRIRIFSGSGLGAKEEQQRVRARFLSLYPDVDAYHVYDEPYFKVYVGDCRTESEAIKLYDRIKGDFPDLFLVPDYINLKKKEQQPSDP
jgi:hypothetical protein